MGMELSPEDQVKVDASIKEQREEAEKLSLAWKEVARTGAGQFVLKDLQSRCNVNNSCVAGDGAHPDPYAVVFQEGKRAVYNHIILYLRHGTNGRK